jgi:hypothetical protein
MPLRDGKMGGFFDILEIEQQVPLVLFAFRLLLYRPLYLLQLFFCATAFIRIPSHEHQKGQLFFCATFHSDSSHEHQKGQYGKYYAVPVVPRHTRLQPRSPGTRYRHASIGIH